MKPDPRSQTKYLFPRSLGLDQALRSKSGKYSLALGHTDQSRQVVQLDQKGLDLLRCCFKPVTVKTLSQKLNLSLQEVGTACDSFAKAGILIEHEPTPERLKRYDRHLLFFGNAGVSGVQVQKRLSQKRIALIGMGGIGNWVALNLIGAGLKEIRLIDFDHIEESNLTRQVLFSEKDLGKKKSAVAKRILSSKNSQTQIKDYSLKIKGVEQVAQAVKGVDFVVLSADRPQEIHDWVDSVCVALGIPYTNLGYRDGIGVVGPMTVPGETSCYQCFKEELGSERLSKQGTKMDEIFQEFDRRYQAPSFGPLNAWVSTLGALEVLKYLGEFGTVETLGVELNLDPLVLSQDRISYARDLNCWNCARPKQ